MNHNRYWVLAILLVTSFLGFPAFVHATDLPSKKVEPSDTARERDTFPEPKAESVVSMPKTAEQLKWDQLDPKALERSMKKARNKSPFSAVPSER